MKDIQWLPFGEKVKDFIRWRELGFLILSFTFLCLIFGWWGIILALILNWFVYSNGGPNADIFNEYPEAKQTKYLYTKEFEESYYKSLKWYEKII